MTKTSPQNRLFHAQARDFAQQVVFAGRRWREESWKRLLLEAWVNAEREEAYATGKADPFPGAVMLTEGLDRHTIVQLGVQVRRLTCEQMSNLIDCTFALGAEQRPPVVWTMKECMV